MRGSTREKRRIAKSSHTKKRRKKEEKKKGTRLSQVVPVSGNFLLIIIVHTPYSREFNRVVHFPVPLHIDAEYRCDLFLCLSCWVTAVP